MIQQTAHTPDIYTDIQGLNRIKQLGKQDEDAALKQVAKQFESMFVDMMLSSMRAANKVFSEDSLLSSQQGEFYQNMYDDQLAISLTQGSSLGLADVIHRQMLSDYGNKSAQQAKGLGALVNPARTQTSVNDTTAPQHNVATLSLYGERMRVPTPIAMPSTATLQPNIDTPEAFIKTLYPIAKDVGQELGVSPKLIVSQAALETGWGQHMIHDKSGKNSFNLFGIKADGRWGGETAKVVTHEYHDGVRVKQVASFRAYESLEHSVRDYAEFLRSSSRYKTALMQGQDQANYGRALQQAGYATDPNYGEKIARIANSEQLNDVITSLQYQAENDRHG